MWIWICVILAAVVTDQVTKQLAVRFLAGGDSVEVIPGIFRFTYVENRGAAFGMLADHRWVFMIISSVAIVALLIYLWKFRPASKWACTALSLIIGGGIGNMIDRVLLNYVIDFLDFCAFPTLWVWVFNVADACVCVGGGILLVWCIVSMIGEVKANKKTEPTASAPSDADGSEPDTSRETEHDGE